MKMSKARSLFYEAVANKFGPGKTEISRTELKELISSTNLSWPFWLVNDPKYRVSRGVYSLRTAELENPSSESEPEQEPLDDVVKVVVQSDNETDSFVPERFPGYVPFGHFNDIKRIIDSRMFYTVYITGHSGNGKTMMIEEACARTKRELIRVNITVETDEDDLLGGFRLIDGNTVWQDGPVVVAMKRGAVLLLDEVDLASTKIMTLQPILEGKPVLLKKIGELVKPAPGFNIFATANTKGQGSTDGRYVGANVMNEAFLERFSITFEQDYPNKSTEKKILLEHGLKDKEFAATLVDWSNQIRQSFEDGVVDEIISTRRLCHIVDAYRIFGDEKKALTLCLNRFDTETKKAFLDLYNKIKDVSTDELVGACFETGSQEPVSGKKEYPF